MQTLAFLPGPITNHKSTTQHLMKHNSHHRHPFRYPLRLVIALAGAMLLVGCAGEGVTPLMQAAHTGDTTELKRQIATAPDINEQSSYGWTALMFASWQGHPNAVEMLLEAGADPNNISGQVPSQFDTVLGHPASTALQEALRERHMQIAQMASRPWRERRSHGRRPDGSCRRHDVHGPDTRPRRRT